MNDGDYDENVRKTFQAKRPDVDLRKVDSFTESSHYWAKTNYLSAADWVSRTVEFLDAEDLRATPNDAVYINLCGLLHDDELPAFIDARTLAFRMLGLDNAQKVLKFIASIKNDHAMATHFGLVIQLEQRFGPIKAAFTEDDKFLLAFIRNQFCHPTLSGYMASIKKFMKSGHVETAKWDRLKSLAEKTKLIKFKVELLEKLRPHRASLVDLNDLLARCGGES